MKNKILVVVLLLSLCPFLAKADEITNRFDSLFKDNTYLLNTDIEIDEYDDLFNTISSSLYNYSFQSYWNAYDDYDYYYLSLNNCDYSEMNCSFDLYRSIAVPGGNYENNKIKSYSNVNITINSDIKDLYSFIDENGNININYDETMFANDEDRNYYISNYVNSFYKYTSTSSEQYQYNDYQKTVTRVNRENDMVTSLYIKKVNNIIFEFVDGEYSVDFKALTDGEIVIKSDTPITDSILDHYLMSMGSSRNGYFSRDGKIINNKVFVKYSVYEDSQSVVKEKHLVSIVKDGIDPKVFQDNNMYDSIDIPADYTDDINYVSSFVNTFSNGKFTIVEKLSDDMYVILYRDNEDIYFHKIKVNFNGYSDYSEEYKKLLGDTLVINSDVKDTTSVYNAIPYDFVVFSCDDEYCDIGYTKSSTYEIHKVKIEFDDTMSDKFKRAFNINEDGTFDVIGDTSIKLKYKSFYSYDFINDTNKEYDFKDTDCILKLRVKGRYESHSVKYNMIEAIPSYEYQGSVIYDPVFYPGDTESYDSLIEWSDKFRRDNINNIFANDCDLDKKMCNIALLRSDGFVEIHKVPFAIDNGYSEEFKSFFPGDSLDVNYIYLNDEDYLFAASNALLMNKTKTWSWISTYDTGKSRVIYDNFESHYMDINYAVGNSEHKKIVDDAIAKLDKADISVNMMDLDFINSFYYDSVSHFEKSNWNSKALNDNFRKVIKDKHIEYYYVPGGGGGTPFMSGLGGNLVLYYDGVGYGITHDFINTSFYNLLFIPNNTKDTISDYIDAAQKRIDDYLGKNSGVVVSYFGKVEQDELSDFDPDLIKNVTDAFLLTYKDRTAEFLIIKDSSKMQKSSFMAVDVINNVEVSSDNVNYPLDTIVTSENITTENSIYKEILNRLKIKHAKIIDINLFSKLIGEIKEFNNNLFTVSLPLNDSSFNLDNLYAYYIDDNGNIEEHKITMEDMYAIFNTTHFSTYIIAEKIDMDALEKTAKEVIDVPNTIDNIWLYAAIDLVSAGIIYYIIKKKS